MSHCWSDQLNSSIEERDETSQMFKSHFAKKMAESEDIFLSEKLLLRRRESESSLVSEDGQAMSEQSVMMERSLQRSKLSSYNFGSVGSLSSLTEGKQQKVEKWISPQKFRDLLDRKENNRSCSIKHPISTQMNSSSHISRVKTVVANTPSNQRNVEKLEWENIELRRQLYFLGRRQEEGRNCLGMEAEKSNYDKLMKEVIRLQNTVNKMEKSNTLYEKSTKQLVTFLEGFNSQLVSSTPGREDEDNFDSLLSRQSFDSFRPSISSYNSIPSRLSEDSFKSIPSRLTEDLSRPSRDSDSRTVGNKADICSANMNLNTSVNRESSNLIRNSPTLNRDASIQKKDSSTMNRDSSTLHRDSTKLNSNSSRLNREKSSMNMDSSLPIRLSSTMLINPEMSYKFPISERKLALRSDSLNSVLGSDAVKSNARRRIMMGSKDVRRDTANRNSSMARRASSSVDLLEDLVSDKQLHSATCQDQTSGEKRTLKVKSKSYASGLSRCGEERAKDAATKTKKDGNKVQRFFKQIRNLVSKDNFKSAQKKFKQQMTVDALEADASEKNSHSECRENKTVIRIGTTQTALPRSISLANTQGMDSRSRVTPNKLISFHHSTPRLEKLK